MERVGKEASTERLNPRGKSTEQHNWKSEVETEDRSDGHLEEVEDDSPEDPSLWNYVFEFSCNGSMSTKKEEPLLLNCLQKSKNCVVLLSFN